MTEHDVDLFIVETDRETALRTLSEVGFETAETPEGWLVKAWYGEVLVDFIYRPVGLCIDRDLIDFCAYRNMQAVPVRVLGVEDVLATKVLSLTEHHLDFGPVLACARSLRELVLWSRLEERLSISPFGRTFIFLLQELGVCPVGDHHAQWASIEQA